MWKQTLFKIDLKPKFTNDLGFVQGDIHLAVWGLEGRSHHGDGVGDQRWSDPEAVYDRCYTGNDFWYRSQQSIR